MAGYAGELLWTDTVLVPVTGVWSRYGRREAGLTHDHEFTHALRRLPSARRRGDALLLRVKLPEGSPVHVRARAMSLSCGDVAA